MFLLKENAILPMTAKRGGAESSFSSKSSKHQFPQTVRAMELEFWHNVHPTPCVSCIFFFDAKLKINLQIQGNQLTDSYSTKNMALCWNPVCCLISWKTAMMIRVIYSILHCLGAFSLSIISIYVLENHFLANPPSPPCHEKSLFTLAPPSHKIYKKSLIKLSPSQIC